MDKQVRGDTSRIILKAAPAEEAFQAEGLLGRRSLEHFPIDSLRRSVGRYRIDPGAARRIAVVLGADQRDLPDLAGLNALPRFNPDIGTHALAAHLHDALFGMRGLDDFQTLGAA